MNPLSALITILALTADVSLAQDLGPSAPPQDHPIFLVGATVHTVSAGDIENGVVSLTEGKIGIVGRADDIMPRIRLSADTQIIDLSGKHLYPGLIDSVTRLGLEEFSAVRAMNDYNEVGDMTPEVRAYVSVNPDSTIIPTARANGVLTFGVFPSAGTIPGRASVLAADGWTNEDMAITRDAGLVINWPAMRVNPNARRGGGAERRDRTLANLDTVFDNAVAYAARHDQRDLKLEAIATVLPSADGQRPVFINADDYDQITAAVNWAVQRELKPVIVGGRDAELCSGLLVSTATPVVIGGVYNFPKRADAPYDQPYTLPARLQAAGVKWSLTMNARHAHERNLPDAAAMAVAFGLEPEAALRGITLSAAEILGLGDRLGSIEQGKDATLFVTDADILDVTSIVEAAWIRGRTIDLSNKQTRLRDKYMEKYRQLDMLDSDD